jgi:hypothetical protein
MLLIKLEGNKKGVVDVLNLIIFLVLNIIFISAMFVFIGYAGDRAVIYEQTYAKQICLFIDNARPDMAILLDVSDGLEKARKSGADLSNAFSLKDGKVIVDLGSGGGYSYEYFSDYNVDLKLVGDELSIGISERVEVVEDDVSSGEGLEGVGDDVGEDVGDDVSSEDGLGGVENV